MGTQGFPRRSRRSLSKRIVQPLPRCATQQAASLGSDLYRLDLKTAFVQGEDIGARMKKSAYGLNGAPRRWWQVVDTALLNYGLVPTRANRCTFVLYGDQKTPNALTKKEPSARS